MQAALAAAFAAACLLAAGLEATAAQEAEPVSPPAVTPSSPAMPPPSTDPVPPAAPSPPAAPVPPAPAAPAEGVAPAAPAAAESGPQLEFTPFNDKLFLEAKRSGAPVGLYFEADWCHPCREMHARTLRDPAVLQAAAGFRLFRVDMTRPGGYVELVEKSFRILGAPTVIVFGPDGKERTRRFGFIPPADFVRMLEEGRKPSPAS